MTTYTKTGGVQAPAAAGGVGQRTNRFAYFVFADGTTTITFLDGAGGDVSYAMWRQDWAPVVAGRRRSPLGGRTLFEDVVEEFTITIRGGSAADAYNKLAVLARLLDQAEAWSLGEPVSAVLVKFAPKGSFISNATNPLQAVILGRAPGDQTAGVTLSGAWNAAGTHFIIPEVRVRFLRRGLWLANTEDSVTTGVITHGELVTTLVTTPADVPSPTRLTLSQFGYGHAVGRWYHGGFIIVGEPVSGVSPIILLDAESGTATGWTSVTDAGQNPRNTNILRYTPTGTTESTSGDIVTAIGGATLPSACDLVGVYVNVRPHTSTNFRLRAKLSGSYRAGYTPVVGIPAESTAYPRWVFLGQVGLSSSVSELYLMATADTAAGTLDVDSVVLVDAHQTQVLALLQAPSDDIVSASDYGQLDVDHKLLSLPAPSVSMSLLRTPSYAGDPIFQTKALTLHAILLATGGGTGTDGNEWRQAEYVGDTVLTTAWTAARRKAFLAPE